ncbi:unnamed protein product [Rotaria sordida]|uniref:Uncharacterized protein n=1 Tax=Rotaria sordida TaxID=392033 RepID=A0A819B6Q0_9BILA|nr:unnamed protein product [Rotaria sordida]
MRKYSSCSSLLQRIRDQHLRDAWNTQIEYIQKAWITLFLYFVVLLIFQCHNRVYNAWEGPFPMDLYQFRNHLNMNYNLFGFKSFFSFRWFLFQPEYIQIELGKNVIDQSIENTFRVFYGHYSYEKLLYTFNRVVEPMIDTSHMPLFIKFYAYKQSYPQIHYPYRFQSLNINTLRCIGKQLGISSREFIHWSEKSICSEKIEQIYKQNPSVFNIKAISKCGIVIGYLYRPTNEFIYPGYSYEQVKFSDHVRVFDASCSYTPYISYVMFTSFYSETNGKRKYCLFGKPRQSSVKYNL